MQTGVHANFEILNNGWRVHRFCDRLIGKITIFKRYTVFLCFYAFMNTSILR